MAGSGNRNTKTPYRRVGLLWGNLDGGYGSRLCENAVNQMPLPLSMQKACDGVNDEAVHSRKQQDARHVIA